jgi:hypothetical protein
MSMPEAAMHEDDGVPFRQHNVWLAGQVFPMKAEPETHPVQDTANANLGPSIA